MKWLFRGFRFIAHPLSLLGSYQTVISFAVKTYCILFPICGVCKLARWWEWGFLTRALYESMALFGWIIILIHGFLTAFFFSCRVVGPLIVIFYYSDCVWKVLLDGPGGKQLVHGQARSFQQPRLAGRAELPAR